MWQQTQQRWEWVKGLSAPWISGRGDREGVVQDKLFFRHPQNSIENRFNCAQMPAITSGEMSVDPLFSYTFPDRPSFLTSFERGGFP
jgi:hypothetical protein